MGAAKSSTTAEQRATLRGANNALKPFRDLRGTMPLQNVSEYAMRGLTDKWLPLTSAGAPSRSAAAWRDRGWLIQIMAAALIALAFATASGGPGHAENAEISHRRASERLDFTNDEIKDGFLKIALTAELQLGAPAERVRKFDEPVRIFVVSKALPDRRPELAAIVADIRNHVNHLDVAVTDDRRQPISSSPWSRTAI
jgi:hypothetical protein